MPKGESACVEGETDLSPAMRQARYRRSFAIQALLPLSSRHWEVGVGPIADPLEPGRQALIRFQRPQKW